MSASDGAKDACRTYIEQTKLLVTLEQKLELLDEAGVDVVIVEPFSREFARTPAEVFVRHYVQERIRRAKGKR